MRPTARPTGRRPRRSRMPGGGERGCQEARSKIYKGSPFGPLRGPDGAPLWGRPRVAEGCVLARARARRRSKARWAKDAHLAHQDWPKTHQRRGWHLRPERLSPGHLFACGSKRVPHRSRSFLGDRPVDPSPPSPRPTPTWPDVGECIGSPDRQGWPRYRQELRRSIALARQESRQGSVGSASPHEIAGAPG